MCPCSQRRLKRGKKNGQEREALPVPQVQTSRVAMRKPMTGVRPSPSARDPGHMTGKPMVFARDPVVGVSHERVQRACSPVWCRDR